MNSVCKNKMFYGNDLEIVSKSDGLNIYRVANKTGDILITEHQVFPGITLTYNDVHMQKHSVKRKPLPNVFEINHCREGRIEYELGNTFYYLSTGDLSINKIADFGKSSFYPISHYHGISITVDIEKTPNCLSCLLDDVNIKPAALMKKFCSNSDCFIMRSTQRIEHIFSELYSVPESIKKGYLKVKILELLLFLSGIDTSTENTTHHSYTKSQVMLAKKVCAYITSHMAEKHTIDDLSSMFNVSATQLKNCFKGVYGTSVYSYTREQKMQAAALLLKNSDRTVLDIAGEYGYDNASKFAKAFKDVMGILPHEYRKIQN